MTDDFDAPPPVGSGDERLALVSAYADGEATAAERARVEADAELLALAERYRGSKAIVADVSPLSASRKQSILAAAVAERRAINSPAQPSAARVSAPPRPDRTGSTRWLSIAAGLVALCAGGIFVATRLGDGGSDDSADVATEAAATAPNFALDDGGATEGTAGGDERHGEDAESPPQQGPAADTLPAEAAADLSTPASVFASGEVLEVPADRDLAVVTDADDLIRWHADVPATTLDVAGSGTEICDQRIRGWAKYQAPATGDDTPASVLVVVVKPSADRLNALDPETCEVVLRADLP